MRMSDLPYAVLAILAIVVSLAGVSYSVCPDENPASVWCPGHATSTCVGPQAGCSGRTNTDLASDDFAVAYSKGRYASPSGPLELCWTDTPCEWFIGPGTCGYSPSNSSPHNIGTYEIGGDCGGS